MKKITICFSFLVAVLAFANVQKAPAQKCKITDPTGTPLNVRASPNGKILRKITNGTIVYIENTSSDSKGRPWAQISQSIGNQRKILGWVFREFIDCDSEGNIQTETLKTEKGYFCGFSEGDGGYLSIRVGNVVKGFSIINEEHEVKYVGFKERQKWFDEALLGTEIIVSYVFKKPIGSEGGATNIVRILTLTGKVNRKTKSCGFGL